MNTTARKAALQRYAASRAASRGMTLIEILVVLAIIGLIVGGVAVVASNALGGAQEDTARNEVTQMEGYVEMYQVQKKGKCPKSMQELKAAGIVKKVKEDPWGTEYKIKCPGENNNVDISSAGKDKEFGTDDDINSWESEKSDEEDK